MKINKKGIVLVEAIIAVGILMAVLLLLALVTKTTIKMQDNSLNLVNQLNIKKITNNLEYMKKRLMAKGKATEYGKENKQYAGWDTLKITLGSQTLNDLDGIYLLEGGLLCDLTDTGYNGCLVKILDDEWGYLVLSGETDQFDVKNDGRVEKNVLKKNYYNNEESCSEPNVSCMGYRIKIQNSPNNSYEEKSYLDIFGNKVILQDKKLITIEIQNGKNNTPKKYNYLLSLY